MRVIIDTLADQVLGAVSFMVPSFSGLGLLGELGMEALLTSGMITGLVMVPFILLL